MLNSILSKHWPTSSLPTLSLWLANHSSPSHLVLKNLAMITMFSSLVLDYHSNTSNLHKSGSSSFSFTCQTISPIYWCYIAAFWTILKSLLMSMFHVIMLCGSILRLININVCFLVYLWYYFSLQLTSIFFYSMMLYFYKCHASGVKWPYFSFSIASMC